MRSAFALLGWLVSGYQRLRYTATVSSNARKNRRGRVGHGGPSSRQALRAQNAICPYHPA